MSDDAQEWRWVGEDGVEKLVNEPELIARLSSEALPAYTLVWRRGWGEWLPAMQVAELAWALPPGKVDEPVKAKEAPAAEGPPAPPLYRYPVLKRRAEHFSTAGGKRSPRGSLPLPKGARAQVPRPASSEGGVPSPRDSTLGPRAALEPETIEQADIEELAPSAPDASDREMVITEVEDVSPHQYGGETDDDAATRVVASPVTEDMRDDAETRVVAPPEPTEGIEPPTRPLYVGPHRPPPSERPPPSQPVLPSIPPPPAPPTGFSPGDDHPAGARKVPLHVYVLGGLVLLLALVVVGLLVSRPSEPVVLAGSSASPSLETSAAAPASAPAASSAGEDTPRVPPCRLKSEATQLAEWAYVRVAPTFAQVPGSTRVALGYAQSDIYAMGITVDPQTLDSDQVFRQYRKTPLSSVVPTTAGDKLRFAVARTDAPLAAAVTVDASKPFLVGLGNGGLARLGEDGGSAELIWPLDATEITAPRVATVPGFGHAVTFRSGGQTGKVMVGWLSPEGSRKSALRALAVDGDLVGTPQIAANGERILVSFASRGASAAHWGTRLAAAGHGELPTRAAAFSIPPGGPGEAAIAPSAAGLAGGSWLLQWTEGAAGNRQLRAITLDADLRAVGDSLLLSKEDDNSGMGAVWVSGENALVVFLVANEQSHQLWGTSLTCPAGKG